MRGNLISIPLLIILCIVWWSPVGHWPSWYRPMESHRPRSSQFHSRNLEWMAVSNCHSAYWPMITTLKFKKKNQKNSQINVPSLFTWSKMIFSNHNCHSQNYMLRFLKFNKKKVMILAVKINNINLCFIINKTFKRNCFQFNNCRSYTFMCSSE